ncbi:MAG: hypothetical protein HGA41_02075 [Syntrophaceae bacterium]|nr:hypothetical protein [Syntrophaceae bacterium]
MAPVTLVIFDYSGTLSLESTLFARPNYLMKHLKESGLMKLGIESPETFWSEIVNPTWQKGSTTPVGYKKVIRDRISAILSRNMSIELSERISYAASFFVDSYLSHSRIDERWRPVLNKLQSHPSLKIIVATDHYAEATGYIIRFLHELQIQGREAKHAFAIPDYAGVVVACSADLGFHKADSRFWDILKTGLNLSGIRRVLFIDDFGYNEQKEDRYSAGEKVEQRKNETVKMLQKVFSSPVQLVPFMMGKDGSERVFGELITQTSEIIDSYVADSDY